MIILLAPLQHPLAPSLLHTVGCDTMLYSSNSSNSSNSSYSSNSSSGNINNNNNNNSSSSNIIINDNINSNSILY